MGRPADDESRGDDEIVEGSVARQVTTMSEKQGFEKDVESAGTKQNGAYTHIDEAVAARIAENVDDFMVSANRELELRESCRLK